MLERYCFFLIAVFISGCSAIPHFEDEEKEGIAKLSSAVECEILLAFNNIHPNNDFDVNQWIASYTITSEAEDSAAAGADPLGWIIPANVDKLVLNAGASLDRVATRTGTAEYSLRLNKSTSEVCSDAARAPFAVTPADFRLRTWVDQVSNATVTPNVFSYSVDVVVTAAAHLSTDVNEHRFSGTFGASGRRKVTRTVDFAFAQIPNPQPAKVFVTNFPGANQPTRKAPTKVHLKAGGAPAGEAIPPAALELTRSQLLQFRIMRSNNSR